MRVLNLGSSTFLTAVYWPQNGKGTNKQQQIHFYCLTLISSFAIYKLGQGPKYGYRHVWPRAACQRYSVIGLVIYVYLGIVKVQKAKHNQNTLQPNYANTVLIVILHMRHNGGQHMYCFMTDEGYLCSMRGSLTKFF